MLKLIPRFHKTRLLGTELAALCTFSLVVWLTNAKVHAHELEDGFVERAVAVIVRPDHATISYSIGANEATRKRLIAKWNGDEEERATDLVPSDGESTGGADNDFLRVVGGAVLKGTDVEIDGASVDLELVEVIAAPRHHIEATVVMRLKMPIAADGAGALALTVFDRSFQADPNFCSTNVESKTQGDGDDLPEAPKGFDGAFRYAIKGAQGVMLNRSTVAPILVRAQRRLVAEIPGDEIDSEQQFSAEVILP